MKSDIFCEIKRRVPTAEAARFYGLHPNRSGFICCPLHGPERTPSLKVYADGWHCFGCGAGGSVVDLVGVLFGLDPMGAVRKLDADFHLALPLDRPLSHEERAQAQRRQRVGEVYQQFQDWRERLLTRLSAAYRVGWIALRDKRMETWTDAEVLAVKRRDAVEHWADALDSGDLEEQMRIFRDREGVERLCSQILNDTRTR